MLTEEQQSKVKTTVLNLNALGKLGRCMSMHLLKDMPRTNNQSPDSPRKKSFLKKTVAGSAVLDRLKEVEQEEDDSYSQRFSD